MKRGLASPCVHSALAMTRRSRLQLLRVVQVNSLKRRAGFPLALALLAGLRQLSSDRAGQTRIAGQAER